MIFQLEFIINGGDGVFALTSFDMRLYSCDRDYSDFTGWDFEDKMMGSWMPSYDNLNYKWDLIEALNSAYGDFIKQHDHTTMTLNGYMVEVTSKKKDKAPNGYKTYLKSVPVKSTNGKSSFYCLIFWFWRRSGNDSLDIFQTDANTNVSLSFQKILPH